MSSAPTTINVQIDQDALRKQVGDAIQEALTEVSQRLLQAAWSLDPEGITAGYDKEFQSGYDQGVRDAQDGEVK